MKGKAMENIWILAQAQGAAGENEITSTPVQEGQTSSGTKVPSDSNSVGGSPQKRPGFEPTTIILLVVMFVFMYMVLFRGPRKRQQEHNQMVQSLEKNDKVQTIGGIIGTVVDVREGEVVLKVDEANNTKIKVSPTAIGKNLSKEKK
jgi:preprotein translocase subunit YajC